jgi:hypothetical protein
MAKSGTAHLRQPSGDARAIEDSGSHRRLSRDAGVITGAGFIALLVGEVSRTYRLQPDVDFTPVIAAARMLLQGGARALYSPTAQKAAEMSYVGGVVPHGQTLYFLDPAPAAALVIPFAWLPYRAALAIFLLLSLGCLALSGWLLLTRVLHAPLFSTGGLLVIVCTASLSSGWDLAMANWDAMLLLALVGAIIVRQRNHPLIAGLLLSCLLLKPQVIWLVPVVLLVTHEWRTLTGLVLGGLLWLAAFLLLVGPAGLAAAWHLDAGVAQGEAAWATGIPGLVATVLPSSSATDTCLAIELLLAASTAWALRRALRADPVFALGIAVAASLLLAPHVFAQDLALMGVPLLLWFRRSPKPAVTCMLLLAVATLPLVAVSPDDLTSRLIVLPQAIILIGLLHSARACPAGQPNRQETRPREMSNPVSVL